MKIKVNKWLGATILVLALVGCGAPKGDTGGRIDPYQTTESDRRSHKASIPELLEFSDRVAEELVQQIAEIESNAGTDTRLVLVMGGIENQTSTPTNDFRQIQRRIQSALFQSRVLKDRFMMVEDRGRVQAELDREGGGEGDLLQEGNDPSAAATYDPKITYSLMGTFSLSTRGDRQQYWFNFKLTNVGTREIVFDEDFDSARVVEDED